MLGMNALQKEQEKELQLAEIGMDILGNARNELYLNMRFLDVALSSLRFCPEKSDVVTGTDGKMLYFSPELLVERYRLGRQYINHLYLHSLMHCLFSHIYRRKERNEELWNLACDMTVEYIIDGLYKKCVHLPQSTYRREWFQRLREEKKTITAEYLYRKFILMELSTTEIQKLQQEFVFDDHSRWEEASKKKTSQEREKNWDDIRDRMQVEMETFSKEAADDVKSLEEQVRIENRKRYDYKEFLRKFSVLKEEMKVDMDSFDYIFYNYGMNLYGNMPLIEHLETKEEQKVEDFILVIDTSMSCKGELVQRFLEQTYSILSEAESFARKINIHIIQCDDRIQEDVVITSREQMEQYMKNFTVRGQGGTDFRPVFTYVNELKLRKQFQKLKGLVYFTDGYGTFPARKPEYETAFVFMKDDYRDVDVPPWAIKLILDPEEFME